MPASNGYLLAVSLIFGLTVGSFLNAVIYRLGQEPPLSLLEPKTSICPSCRHPLGAMDLVPVLSFLWLRGRCRYCKCSISWRYCGVELLTSVLFGVMYLVGPGMSQPVTTIALQLYAATLVPVFFIDLATFTIPDSLNILLLVIPVALDIYSIVSHEAGHALIAGWVPVSMLGGLVGALTFGAVRVVGWLWKRVEAMGLGDVLLARGMGAMLVCLAGTGHNPLWLFPSWVLLSCLSGIVVGPVLIWQRLKAAARNPQTVGGSSEAVPVEADEGQSNLVRELADVAWCIVLGDVWHYLAFRFRRKPDRPAELPAEQWVPLPSAIPFGPFLVIGFLAAVLWGGPLTTAYLHYALRR